MALTRLFKYGEGDTVVCIANPYGSSDLIIGGIYTVLGAENLLGEIIYCVKDYTGKLIYTHDCFELLSEDEYPMEELPVEEVDMVNHPPHYNQYPCEVIDITTIATKDLKGVDAFCMGNAIKYILRSPFKGTFLEDLKKAVWYLNRIVENNS